jgi:hypothetical protein
MCFRWVPQIKTWETGGPIAVPGPIVGQPCLGTNGELIVTYGGPGTPGPSGCLAIGLNRAIKWKYERTDGAPLAAAVASQDRIGYLYVRPSDNKCFLDVLAETTQ